MSHLYFIKMFQPILQVSEEAELPEDDVICNGLDEFTRKLTEDDARVLVDLLKLAVAGRAGPQASPAITRVLTGKGINLYIP